MSDSHGSESEVARSLRDGVNFAVLRQLLTDLPSFPIDAEKVKQAHLANEWFTKFIGLFGSSNLDLQHLDTVCLGSNLEYLQTPANEPVTHDQIQELRARYTAKQSALTQVQAQIVEPTLEPIRVAREQALHIEAEAQWQELPYPAEKARCLGLNKKISYCKFANY